MKHNDLTSQMVAETIRARSLIGPLVRAKGVFLLLPPVSTETQKPNCAL